MDDREAKPKQVENEPDESGALGKASEHRGPLLPSKDDETPLGDTDQHSKVSSAVDPREPTVEKRTGHSG